MDSVLNFISIKLLYQTFILIILPLSCFLIPFTLFFYPFTFKNYLKNFSITNIYISMICIFTL